MKSIAVLVNDRSEVVPQGTTVAQLVKRLNFSPKSILVERNGEAVLRHHYEKTLLENGDRLEFIRMVAGG